MTEETLQHLWKSYQDAWADVSTNQREQLLRASVAEAVVFTSPNAKGQGFDELVTHIADFQQQFPGAYFQGNKLIEQNGQLLSDWTMFNRDGSEFLTGQSYARFNDAGRLTFLAGFWKL